MHAQRAIRTMLDPALLLDQDKSTRTRLTMKNLKALIRKSTFGMAAALSIPALAIAQPQFEVELGNTGKLLDRGASVAVSVKVACVDETTDAFAQVRLAQRTRGGNVTQVLTGSQDIQLCNSMPQTLRFLPKF